MKYVEKSFTVTLTGEAYSTNWDRIFKKVMTETACAHGRLAFDQGGALVICLDCPRSWALIPIDSDEIASPPLGLGRSDVRLAPRFLKADDPK